MHGGNELHFFVIKSKILFDSASSVGKILAEDLNKILSV